MLQVIDRKAVYVVDFDTMPELPITGLTQGEATYKNCFVTACGGLDNAYSKLGSAVMSRPTYAEALTNAIETGIITEPGKYGIHLVPGTANYEIYNIIEK